jgi:CxxC-x17-CxxC domain-containing protein
MNTYADKALRCVTCGAAFVFTAGEQQFHAAKGFTNEPRRCPACRQARRSRREAATAGAAPQPEGKPAPAAPSQAEEARSDTAAATDGPARRRFVGTCSACGGEAVLPFEPIGNRPVLCSACYDKIRALA